MVDRGPYVACVGVTGSAYVLLYVGLTFGPNALYVGLSAGACEGYG
jgi:hypothetical protein